MCYKQLYTDSLFFSSYFKWLLWDKTPVAELPKWVRVHEYFYGSWYVILLEYRALSKLFVIPRRRLYWPGIVWLHCMFSRNNCQGQKAPPCHNGFSLCLRADWPSRVDLQGIRLYHWGQSMHWADSNTTSLWWGLWRMPYIAPVRLEWSDRVREVWDRSGDASRSQIMLVPHVLWTELCLSTPQHTQNNCMLKP